MRCALVVVALLIGQLEGAPSQRLIKQLRDIPRPAELTLSSAKDLHSQFLIRSRTIEALHGHHHSKLVTPTLALAPPPPSPSPSSNFSVPLIFPTAFGADPTGVKDSTDAFTAAVAALLKGGAPHHMASGINDLGGATLHLGGGQYLINAPIVIPMYYGNLLITDGTLRAGPNFPPNKWLIMVGDTSCNPPGGQGSCNEFVNIADVLFDCSHVASGAVYIAHAMGATIGPAFIISFNQVSSLLTLSLLASGFSLNFPGGHSPRWGTRGDDLPDVAGRVLLVRAHAQELHQHRHPSQR
jgi:hypothetical protein